MSAFVNFSRAFSSVDPLLCSWALLFGACDEPELGGGGGGGGNISGKPVWFAVC